MKFIIIYYVLSSIFDKVKSCTIYHAYTPYG